MIDNVRHELRAAIARYRSTHGISEDGHAVLDRLTPRADPDEGDDKWSRHVVPAFKATPRARWPNLIRACLCAEQEQRHHKGVVEQIHNVRDGAAKAEKALATLKRFVKTLLDSKHASAEWRKRAGPPWHPANYFRSGHPEREALRSLEGLTRFAKSEAAAELRLYSQKTGPRASRLVGIRLINATMSTYALDAGWKLTAQLAEAVLDAGDVSEDMVGNAKRNNQAARSRRKNRKNAPTKAPQVRLG